VQRRISLALFLAGGLLCLEAATLQRLSLNDMIDQSTAIVRGKVTGSYAAFQGPVIYTHYSVQVSEQFKGSPMGTVDLVVPGGTANNLRQNFAGAPQFNAGDEFVFFLWTSRAGLTQIIGLTQGLFQLAPGTAADPVTTRAASRELMLDSGTGQPVKDQTLVMNLSDLRTQIGARLMQRAHQ
jgi:hypothetical protein